MVKITSITAPENKCLLTSMTTTPRIAKVLRDLRNELKYNIERIATDRRYRNLAKLRFNDTLRIPPQNVRIVRALILGEPERGQTQYQVLCFVSRLNHHEVIPTESMVHLRQKNPHLVRTAEERRGLEHLHMDMAVNMSRAGHLDTLIHSVCKGAYQGFYARKSDWLDKEVVEFEPLLQTAAAAGLHRCPSTLDLWQPCTCSYRLRLEWLPCLLKYCRGRRDTAVKANPYKCGIRSCSQSYRFDYYVPHRVLCPWDEET